MAESEVEMAEQEEDNGLTRTRAEALPKPTKGYTITWCPKTPGFGVRVTAKGARAWVAERRIDGKTVRRTLGKVTGRDAISAKTARAQQIDISSELQRGTDRVEVKREQRKVEKAEARSFEQALLEYVKTKRNKAGLGLKQRTKDDYAAMLDAPSVSKRGLPTLGGPLHEIAQKSVARITAADIKDLYDAIEPRGERQRTYAMQVLRAVLRHEGAVIEDNPLSPTTAGKGRVALAPSKGNPTPIPAEKLGAWWRAACAINTVSSAQLRFQLLTGCRPGEVASIMLDNVDLEGGRVVLPDPKNRKAHTIVLSTQALAIIKPYVEGRKRNGPVFGVVDAGKTLVTINAAASVDGITPHKLRHTFATIAARLVNAFALKKLLNQSVGGDVTAAHYVHVDEADLRAGWQAVADFITTAK